MNGCDQMSPQPLLIQTEVPKMTLSNNPYDTLVSMPWHFLYMVRAQLWMQPLYIPSSSHKPWWSQMTSSYFKQYWSRSQTKGDMEVCGPF